MFVFVQNESDERVESNAKCITWGIGCVGVGHPAQTWVVASVRVAW